MLRPAPSPSRYTTLYIESSDSFVASAAVSIATGWSEPVPGRDLHPLKSSAFSRRTVSPIRDFLDQQRSSSTPERLPLKSVASSLQYIIPCMDRPTGLL
jgi:hypothetical protein